MNKWLDMIMMGLLAVVLTVIIYWYTILLILFLSCIL